jgi:uncharacterized protein (DUF362 family)
MAAALHESLATIADDEGASPVDLLARTLDRAGFWTLLTSRCRDTDRSPATLRIVIKPDLTAFAAGSPTATDPALVEALIDLLHSHGYRDVAVVASADSSSLWAENRDVLATAELLGYRFATHDSHPYDVVDLAEDLVPIGWPPGALLDGTSISRTWNEAHARVLFSKNKTDETEAYALGLENLIGVLPLADKDYYYRHRFDPGTVAHELLGTVAPHFALIDAIVSSHGSGGSRSPLPLDTKTLIASTSTVLADFAGALKMGIDPAASRVTAQVLQHEWLPSRYRIDGNLAVYDGWISVHPVVLDAARKRRSWVSVDRAVKPWLQQADTASFPFKEPLDAQAQAVVAPRFANVDDDASALGLYAAANYGLGWLGDVLNSYRVLYDKDRVRRRQVALGIDPSAYDAVEYEKPLSELLQLRQVLRELPADDNGLRWRYVNDAVVFEIARSFPVPFDELIAAIDVSKTIQFMNDYLGGVIVPVARDGQGRVTHQAERNLYLPQPNYLVLSQGTVIDVTKLEFVEYSDDQQRMSWKTIKSENGSATYDDGLVTFRRRDDVTDVSIFGRQLFTLPPFWKAIDLDLVPALKRSLVNHAYTTFFQRTFSNFEALLEGRDIRIGRAWHDPIDSPGSSEPMLTDVVARRLTALLEKHGPAIAQLARPREAPAPTRIDDQGFAHFSSPGAPAAGPANAETSDVVSRFLTELWAEFAEAARRDLAAQMERLERV